MIHYEQSFENATNRVDRFRHRSKLLSSDLYVLKIVEDLQNNEILACLEKEIAQCCKKWNFPILQLKYRKWPSVCLQDSSIAEKGITTDKAQPSLKCDVFLPTIDCLVSELKRRFNTETGTIHETFILLCQQDSFTGIYWKLLSIDAFCDTLV